MAQKFVDGESLESVRGKFGTAIDELNAIPSKYVSYDASSYGGKFATLADANLAITNAINATTGKNNRDGKRVDIGANGNYVSYWWKGGFLDANLIETLNDVNSFSNLGTPVDLTGTKGTNSINIKNGVVTASGSFESSGFIAVKSGDIIEFTGRVQKTDTLSTGIAGYANATAASYIPTLDSNGLAFGELISLDRYILETGITPIDNVVSLESYRVVIPFNSGINFIRGCSLLSGGVTLKITKYDLTTFIPIKNGIVKNQATINKSARQIDKTRSELIRATIKPTYTNVALTLTDDFQLRANFGGTRSATGHKVTATAIDVVPGQMIRVWLTTYGTLGMPLDTPITGIAGYRKDDSFVAEIDEYGLPVGTIWSNDRYFQRTGITRDANAVIHQGVELVIPDGVYKIKMSSQYVGGFAMPMRLELSSVQTNVPLKDALNSVSGSVNSGTPVDVTGAVSTNIINVKTGVTQASGSDEATGFIPCLEGDVFEFSGRIQNYATATCAGVAGYTSNVNTSYVSTLGADGLAIGELVSVDRYIKETGIPIYDSFTTFTKYRFIIPAGSGIKYIRGSNRTGTASVIKISKYDLSVFSPIKKDILNAVRAIGINKLVSTKNKSDIKLNTIIPNYQPVTLTLVDNEQVRVKDGLIRAATGHKRTTVIPVTPGQFVRASLTTYGTLGMPVDAAITGAMGLDAQGVFVSDLDDFGLPIGTLWSNDRYYQRTGKTKTIDAIIHTNIEFIIPDGVYGMQLSSQYSGAFAMPIKVELGSTADAKTVKEALLNVPTGSVLPGNYQPINGIKIAAHRGMWRNFAPENSMDGFALAARFGYKHIEMDTVRTLDGQWVVLHDSTLDRTFNKASDYTAITGVTAATTTLANLRANYVHITPNVRMRRPIPTLFEFLQLCKKFKIIPFVEMKDLNLMTNAYMLELFNLCKSVLGEEGFYIMTFTNPELLDYLRTVSKKVKLVYFGSDINKPIAAGNAVYAMDYNNITPALVKQAHDGGIEIAGWTVPANNYWMLSNLGVDISIGEGVAPELNNQQIVLTVSSNSDFADFTTNGTLANGVVTLAAGQTLSYASPAITGLVNSGQYLEVDIKGNSVCAISGYNHTTNNTAILDDYMTITHQVIITNNTPSLIFTAGTGGCVIKDVTFKVAKL